MRKGVKRMVTVAGMLLAIGGLTACGSSSQSSTAETTVSKESPAGEASEEPETSGGSTLGIEPLADRTTLSIGFFARCV